MNKKQRKERIYTLFSKLPKGWGWYYFSTVIDDYSRYIIHWELCSSMTSDDVSRTIDKAIEKAGVTFQNLLIFYQIINHVILHPLSNSISVRNVISNISTVNPFIRRHRERSNDITERWKV